MKISKTTPNEAGGFWKKFGITKIDNPTPDTLIGVIPDGVVALTAVGQDQMDAQTKTLSAIGIVPGVMAKVKDDEQLVLYRLDESVPLQAIKEQLGDKMSVHGPGEQVPLPSGRFFDAEQYASHVGDLSVLDHLEEYQTSHDQPTGALTVSGGTNHLKPIIENQSLSLTQILPIKPWRPLRIDPDLFPDHDGRKVPTTVDNIAFLLEKNGITVRYNVIKKKTEIVFPDIAVTTDNADNVSMTHIISLATKNGLRTDLVPASVEAIGDRNAYNPVKDWIESKPWDGHDRLAAFYDTLRARDDYPKELKEILMRKWLLSAVAAAFMKTGFKSRGVLTLQGSQGLGKTSWGQRLINDPVLASSVIKTDHHLDGGNKDSQIGAITHFIVEIGELESSFKRDVSRLKGFLTADHDKLRRPYARAEAEYPRRTIFYATVNQADFLVDNTGNSRWWTIPVIEIDYEHDIDMQQLFAQLAVDFENGDTWWLTQEEELLLAAQNKLHKNYSLVAEILADYIDFEKQPCPEDRAYTASELLVEAGIERPTNAQAKECGAILRETFGEPKRINGRAKWRLPLWIDPEYDVSPVQAKTQGWKDQDKRN
ncbi:VapE domain-containing protein [Parasphingorhabdus sp.]|uniref:VapE domain-containing protein n=1 Tax=Parasphingorhabdus sp. TaxID=2709688 RepID=UPI00300220E9